MRPKWYDKSNIYRVKKRIFYYSVYIKGHDKPFFIDLEDLKTLKGLRLRYDGNYIQTQKGALHRLICNGPIIHHKNKNKLDNRKVNLEVCKDKKDHYGKHFRKGNFDFYLKKEEIDPYIYDDDEPYSKADLRKIKGFY